MGIRTRLSCASEEYPYALRELLEDTTPGVSLLSRIDILCNLKPKLIHMAGNGHQGRSLKRLRNFSRTAHYGCTTQVRVGAS